MNDPGPDLLAIIGSPFTEGAPTGEDLRLDQTSQSIYFRLRDAQADARSEERRAESEPEHFQRSLELWGEVVALASDALASRTKDLEIAAWLVEGLTRRRGLDGFATGARVVASLLDGFWARGLHPEPAADEPWEPLAVITGLSGADRPGSLVPPLHRVALFEHVDGTPITLWSYDYARELSTLDPEKLRETRMATLVPSFAALEIAARGPARHDLARVLGSVDAALAAWRAIQDAIAAAGAPNVSTGRVLDVLDRIRRIAALYAPETGPPAVSVDGRDADDGGVRPAETARGRGVAPGAPGGSGNPSREDMFEQVLRIATVFHEREPNSPFSLTLAEAVRRARLPLTELLREVIPDDHQRLSVLTALGIRVTFDE